MKNKTSNMTIERKIAINKRRKELEELENIEALKNKTLNMSGCLYKIEGRFMEIIDKKFLYGHTYVFLSSVDFMDEEEREKLENTVSYSHCIYPKYCPSLDYYDNHLDGHNVYNAYHQG